MFLQTTKQARYTSRSTLTEITTNPSVKGYTLLFMNELQFQVKYSNSYE